MSSNAKTQLLVEATQIIRDVRVEMDRLEEIIAAWSNSQGANTSHQTQPQAAEQQQQLPFNSLSLGPNVFTNVFE